MTDFTVIAFRSLFTVAIVVITHLATTSLDYPLVGEVWDKLSHFVAFAVLAMLLDYSFPKKQFGWWKLGSLCGYGILIELIQYYLPHRFFSLLDLSADAIGICIYWFCGHWLVYVPGLKTRWQGVAPPV